MHTLNTLNTLKEKDKNNIENGGNPFPTDFLKKPVQTVQSVNNP